ncbi:MAG: DUF86 domain-containing protein [Prevotella sp.]|nr:DUF86 domain-containing protein [Prevotella sp.]
MSDIRYTTQDRLLEIKESIELIQQWSVGMTSVHDFMISPGRVMAFNACVMRLQVIGEQVGKLMRDQSALLSAYPQIPWNAIYGMRNLISHEYANINENIVVDVIYNELPLLSDVIEQMLSDVEEK